MRQDGLARQAVPMNLGVVAELIVQPKEQPACLIPSVGQGR
jgi:hypothetical protein